MGRRDRVFLIENCPIVDRATAALIDREEDLEVCGTAEDCESALEQLGALMPDLIVLGTALQGRDGLGLLTTIKAAFPSSRILVFSVDDEALFAPLAIREGAAGYVMKQESTAIFLSAIRQVLSGRTYISERLEERVRKQGHGRQPGSSLHPLETLTARELEIFRMIGQGKNRRQIADHLGLTTKAVDRHRAQIREKLYLRSANDVMRHAIEMEFDSNAHSDEPRLNEAI